MRSCTMRSVVVVAFLRPTFSGGDVCWRRLGALQGRSNLSAGKAGKAASDGGGRTLVVYIFSERCSIHALTQGSLK
jgi:hypothetical protein